MKKSVCGVGVVTCVLLSGCQTQPQQPIPGKSTPRPSTSPPGQGVALPSGTPMPTNNPQSPASPQPTPSASSSSQQVQVVDITPSELTDKRLQALAVSQETNATIYAASFQGNGTQNGIYSFRLNQVPNFTALNEAAFSPQILRDELYYLDLNCVKKFSLTNRSTTLLAGTCGTNGYGFREGAGPQALFDRPSFLTPDASGQLYVADSHNLRVRKIQNNEVSTYTGKWIGTNHPTQGLNYSCLAGVCTAGTLFDPIDRIDYSLRGQPAGEPSRPFIQVNDLSKPEASSTLLSVIQDGDRSSATFWRPGKLAFDTQGNLYVQDRIAFQDHIRRIDSNGKVSTLIANTNRPDPNHEDDALYPQAAHALDSLTKGEQDTIRAFTVSGTKLYILSKHLYVFDLLSQSWKILLNQQELSKYKQFGDPEVPEPGIKSLETDVSGNLYVLLTKAEGLNGSRNKILKIIP